MFITESIAQKRKNDEIRMKIINIIMNTYSYESLDMVFQIADLLYEKECRFHPWNIVEIAGTAYIEDINKILDAIEDSDTDETAIKQMKEAFRDAKERGLS